jgi:Mg-chelatase subunit ChlD
LRAQLGSKCPICRALITELVMVIDAGVPAEAPAAGVAAEAPASPLAHSTLAPAADVAAPREPLRVTRSITGTGDTLVRITTPPLPAARPGVDLCVVLDTSGSMEEEATREDAQGNVKTDGLTVLCIAKHAVRTVCAALSPADRLSVVTFNTHANTLVPLSKMNDRGRAEVHAALERVRPSGNTDLWGGLKAGLQVLAEGAPPAKRAGRLQSLLCLTDGEPSLGPPLAERGAHYRSTAEEFGGALRRKLISLSDVCAPTVHVFGFG